MPIWQDRKHLLRPEQLSLAIAPSRRAGEEGNVEPKLADGRDMLIWTTVNQFDDDTCMISVEGAQELEQEPRGK